ncbi:hypothetical protein J6590_026885 [Homalodisca vitripennis]|nr:hypothetical protein J6590_026885 [Homalodisca vitripennis]
MFGSSSTVHPTVAFTKLQIIIELYLICRDKSHLPRQITETNSLHLQWPTALITGITHIIEYKTGFLISSLNSLKTKDSHSCENSVSRIRNPATAAFRRVKIVAVIWVRPLAREREEFYGSEGFTAANDRSVDPGPWAHLGVRQQSTDEVSQSPLGRDPGQGDGGDTHDEETVGHCEVEEEAVGDGPHLAVPEDGGGDAEVGDDRRDEDGGEDRHLHPRRTMTVPELTVEGEEIPSAPAAHTVVPQQVGRVPLAVTEHDALASGSTCPPGAPHCHSHLVYAVRRDVTSASPATAQLINPLTNPFLDL